MPACRGIPILRFKKSHGCGKRRIFLSKDFFRIWRKTKNFCLILMKNHLGRSGKWSIFWGWIFQTNRSKKSWMCDSTTKLQEKWTDMRIGKKGERKNCGGSVGNWRNGTAIWFDILY